METRVSPPGSKPEDRERAILGGTTLAERAERDGAGFWLRLSDEQIAGLKRIYRLPDGRADSSDA